ncbi:5-formyltetrahydrofolate cyclo-ligase [Ramicandelaber brevisporus]|nr:5-formyltetrahydrofolate cyclo-ligase [Ramicandelaber brevisporus]
MTGTVRQLKRTLRREMHKRLAGLSSATVSTESSAVTAALLATPSFQHAKNISVYANMVLDPSDSNASANPEIDTRGIIRAILDGNKRCFVPRCLPDGKTMQMVHINSWEEFTRLPLNKWRIPELPVEDDEHDIALKVKQSEDGTSEVLGLDLIVMPGFAFDKNRNRLGHGKGFYDRYIKQARAFAEEHGLAPPATIAVALQAQLIDEEIPHDEYDVRPDAILHSSGSF